MRDALPEHPSFFRPRPAALKLGADDVRVITRQLTQLFDYSFVWKSPISSVIRHRTMSNTYYFC